MAVNSISQIVEHVQLNHSKAAAQTVKNRLIEALSQIIRFPQVGKIEDEQTQLRSIIVDGNKIFYLTQADLVLITNIRPRRMRG